MPTPSASLWRPILWRLSSVPSIVLSVLALSGPLEGQETEPYAQVAWSFSPGPHEIAVQDLNGDELKDLVLSHKNRLSIYFQRQEGGFPQKVDQVLRLTGRALAWDIGDLDGDGNAEIVVLDDGKRVRCYARSENSEGLQELETPVLDKIPGFLPDGCRYAPFVNDLDSDGDMDLVIPAQGHCALYLRNPEGQYTKGPDVEVPVRIHINMWGGQFLDTQLYESVRVPYFRITDVNGDDLPDLVSTTPELLSYYLANPQDGIPVTPTFTLDIAALEKKLDKGDDDSFDLDNLFASVTDRVETRSADVNGDNRLDFVIRVGQKISLFLGKPGGVDFEGRPDDLKKVSGNVITHFLHDDNGDGRLDLHIVRVETVSITDALFWLVSSGTLDLDLFIYHNEGKTRLPRKPSRQWTIGVEFPPLLSFANKAEKMEDSLKKRARVNAHAVDVDGDGQSRDILLMPEGKNEIQIYRDTVPEGWRQLVSATDFFQSLKRQIGYSTDESEYSLDLEKFDEWIPLPSHELELETQKRTPDLRWTMTPPSGTFHRSDAVALDLNGDDRDDFLVAMRDKKTALLYLFSLISQPGS